MLKTKEVRNRRGTPGVMGIAALLVATLTLPVSAQTPNLSTSNAAKWGSHIDIEGKWGNKRSLGDIGLFAPLWQDKNSLLFTDIRARYDNDDGREGNFGLGWRQMLANRWNYGLYAFYDARRSPSGNVFQQATLGAELLHHDFDARVNFYIPFAQREYELGGGGGVPFAGIVGGNIVIVTPGGQFVERSLRGADFEVGYRLPVFPWNSMVQLRAYAGAFWFDGENLIKDIAGPRGRLELSWDNIPYLNEGSRLTFGLESQHDDVRGMNNFIITRLRIPLSPVQTAASRLTPQERRMTERIVRDVDIVAGTAQKGGAGAGTTEAAINTYNNEQITSVQQQNTEAGVQSALTGGGTGAVVIVNGTVSTTAPISVGTAQTLLGGGAVLPVRGVTSGATVNFTAPGAAGELSGSISGQAIASLSANSVLGGVTITNTHTDTLSRGILADGVSGVTVFASTINTAGDLGYGMHFQNAPNGQILNSQINALGPDARAIGIESSNGVTADGNTMVARYIGIEVMSSDSVVLTGNSMQSQFGFGIYSQNNTNITIGGNSFGPLIANTQILLVDTSINNAASVGNVDNTSPSAPRCMDVFGSSGTIGYTTGANCTFP